LAGCCCSRLHRLHIHAPEMLAEEMMARLTAANREIQQLRADLAAATARAEAAEAKLTLVERYGADQWRRGNAGKEPQEFNEWQRDLEEWRQSERAAQRSEVQP
jgi:hypothetical protein